MWRLRLDADDEAIERLRAEVPDFSIGVAFKKDGERWFLETSASSNETDAHVALDVGNQVIDRLNFAQSLQDPHFEQVPRSSAVVDENGHQHHFVEGQTVSATASVSVSATGTVSRSGPPPATRLRTRGELILQISEVVPEVDEVARTWARERDPVNLYKIYEIIKDQTSNGLCQMSDLVSNAQIKRFTRTVNHPVGAGERARHSRMSSQPPPNPMSDSDMIQFIANLIDKWLCSLGLAHGVATEVPLRSI